MSDVLAIKGLEKSYNLGKPTEVSILRGADLTLGKGEVVALVAPSGAGKSTLLHIAGLLDSGDSGQIVINGKDYANESDRSRTKARRQDIGFIYQFHHLLPEFSAEENIALPQMADGATKANAHKRAKELLALVGLEDRGHHRPAELSGGEQQRVAFCRAMANGPKLLLADEPTGNLDTNTSARVFDTLMGLVRDTGLSALIATHDPELAAKMDRVLRLDGGRLVAG